MTLREQLEQLFLDETASDPVLSAMHAHRTGGVYEFEDAEQVINLEMYFTALAKYCDALHEVIMRLADELDARTGDER